MFPVFVNLTNRLCVVVGGGHVGQRKMNALLEHGASVRTVCLENQPLHCSSARLEWLTEPYRAEHLLGAELVFAAATPEVNQRVVSDARSRGIWVNAANDPAQGDFFVPAMVRRGGFVLAVSTGGAAPALAHAVRMRLEEQFDEAFGKWVALLNELRPLVLTRVTDAHVRQTLFERLCRWDWLDRVRREDTAVVRAAMLAEIQTAGVVKSSADPV